MEYFFQTSQRLYFVMPYIHGGDLNKKLGEYKRFEEQVVKFYATQIVIGIGELHKRNIMHRNLKLENIMLGQDGYLKLIDYGLAKILEGDDMALT